MAPISDTVPEDFAHAYGELVELVGQISRIGVPNEVPKGPEEISQEVLDEKVDQWKHGDCRGAVTLAEAAIKALQYELASRGFREGAGVVGEDLVALGRIESVLEPAYLTGDEAAQIVEVALPEQLRNARPKNPGFQDGRAPDHLRAHRRPASRAPLCFPPEPLSYLRGAVAGCTRPRRTATEPVDVATQTGESTEDAPLHRASVRPAARGAARMRLLG